MLISASSRTGFDVSGKRKGILKIEQEMANPGFWSDHQRGAAMSQELAHMKEDIARWERLDDEGKHVAEMAGVAEINEALEKEIAAKAYSLKREVETLAVQLTFTGSYDRGSAVLSFHAGAGGMDAEDWAALLLRMYRRFAEKRKWKARTIHEHWGAEQGPGGWGMKNATIIIEGEYAYGYLKHESGVHRLVRISPFSSQKLRHTSFALVDVMPEFVAPEEVDIKPEDLNIDFFRSSGPGGQNVNKRETAVRITHLATGIQVASQAERSQDRNRETAMKLLRSKLYNLSIARRERERQGVRNEMARSGKAGRHAGPEDLGKVSIEWGNQIRSYVMHPYQMVKDHRTGVETGNIDAVLDGGLDEFIEAELRISN